MVKFTPIRKLDFFLAVNLFVVSGVLMTAYPDMSFPKENELHYYSGKLDVLRVRPDPDSKSTHQYLAFYDKKTKKILEFSCAYSQAFFGTSDRSCGSNEDFEPYIGQMATVGWYEQDGFPSWSNNRLQVVTLESEDKVIRSYDDTVAILESDKKRLRYFMIFISLASIFMYWSFGKLPRH